MPVKILSVFGTRPDAIKMCPLVKLLAADSRFESIVCVSAQHREMLDQVLAIFDVHPDYDLNIMKPSQTLFQISAAMIPGIGEVLEAVKPDLVLVHGDTSTAFLAALAAFYQQIPVGHVEAGLRTGNIYSPFPEEMNRMLVGRLATLHFAPTLRNRENLLQEHTLGKIFVTGNTVIDAMRYTTVSDYHYEDPVLESLRDQAGKFVLMTAHRRENLGAPLAAICRAVLRLVDAVPDLHVVYPVHLNPAVRNTVYPLLSGHARIHLTEPVNLRDAHNFMARCRFVMTDSGGIQEEATALGVPTLVLRRETERGEGIETGILKLVGVEEENIFQAARELAENDSVHDKMSKSENPYGDGHACEYIADAIAGYFNSKECVL